MKEFLHLCQTPKFVLALSGLFMVTSLSIAALTVLFWPR